MIDDLIDDFCVNADVEDSDILQILKRMEAVSIITEKEIKEYCENNKITYK